jgi:hypothetical protein
VFSGFFIPFSWRLFMAKSKFLVMVYAAAVSTAAVGMSHPARAQGPYSVTQKWMVGGTGGWDYLMADAASHRLFVTHGTRVEVLDLPSGKVAGAVDGLTRTHGVVIPAGSKVGFISDGGANQVVAFDVKTLVKVAQIPAGTNPDGMTYEASTNTIWAFNGTSKNVTVIDAAAMKPVATIALPGKPEFPASDGKGTVYVNIEDKNEIVRLDAETKTMTATWPLAGCESPSGLAFDVAGGRLFSVCDGKKMAVTDVKTGKSLGSAAVGNGPDAAAYDPTRRLAFSSNGDGTLTVVDASKPGFPVTQTVPTMKGARTMALDATTGTVYVVSSEFGPPAAGQRRPTPVPGTFMVVVVGRE